MVNFICGAAVALVTVGMVALYCCLIQGKRADKREKDIWKEWKDIKDIGRKW